MEHAKVRLLLTIGTGGQQEEELEIDWLTKEEWDELTLEEKEEQLSDDMGMFLGNYIDSGWEEI